MILQQIIRIIPTPLEPISILALELLVIIGIISTINTNSSVPTFISLLFVAFPNSTTIALDLFPVKEIVPEFSTVKTGVNVVVGLVKVSFCLIPYLSFWILLIVIPEFTFTFDDSNSTLFKILFAVSKSIKGPLSTSRLPPFI